MGYSTIQFKDHTDAVVPVKIEAGSITPAQLQTLAASLEGHSNAVYTGVSVFYPNASAGTPTNAQFQLSKDKALITLRDANGRIVKVNIVAPKLSIFDSTIKGVRYVSSTVGASVATAMSTATGKTLTFLQGRFVNKPGRSA